MANGLMERGLKQAEAERAEDAAGWAAPAAATATAPDAITPDTVSEWTPAPPRTGVETMTMRGVASATGVLLVLLIAAGAVGWNLVDTEATGQIRFPGWLLLPLFAAVGVAFLTMFKPELARFTGPIYALLEGLVLGAISRVYEEAWDGIVLQAVAITVLVLGAMAFLYATRIIKVTERFRRIVIGATLAIVVFYVISMLLSIFGTSVPLIWDAGPFGILFSLFVCGIAAFNLALDFDLAERGVKSGLPKQFEWFCAFALTVSLVWLYLEVLRLLGKLRQ
jgi:uncharacterized YccA/Bax inhibitor family protein